MYRIFRLLTLLSLCAALLAACGPAPIVAPALPLPAPTVDPAFAQATAALMKDWTAALQTWDADKIVSLYSPEAVEYDATSDPGFYMNYSSIEGFYRTEGYKTSFQFSALEFFVSGDGRFAAVYGLMKDVEGIKPAVSLLEFKGGKIIWQYDYYGGWKHPGPWIVFPDRANQPDSAAAGEATKALAAWEAAFNRRDLLSCLSFYDDAAQVFDVIDPQWRSFTRPELEKELAAQFASPDFKTTLGNFFVSADGRLAAVQGVYKSQKTAEIPFISILDVASGQVLNQYNFLVYQEK